MSKSGHDKLLKKYEEVCADNLVLHTKIMERDTALAELRSHIAVSESEHTSLEPKAMEPTGVQQKLHELWNSNPLWTVMSMVSILLTYPWSIKFTYAIVWGVFCAQFIRLRVAENRRTRYALNVVFSLFLAIGLLIAWPYIPKPKEQPDFDRSLASLSGKITAWTTGGNSYCYFMLYYFDLQQEVAKQAVVIKNEEYPLYNAHITVTDVDTGQTLMDSNLGEISGGGKSGTAALWWNVAWKLRPSIHYSIWFSARNGVWHQDLQLRKSTKAQCWLAATRVTSGSGKELFQHIDPDYVKEFGNPGWQP